MQDLCALASLGSVVVVLAELAFHIELVQVLEQDLVFGVKTTGLELLDEARDVRAVYRGSTAEAVGGLDGVHLREFVGSGIHDMRPDEAAGRTADQGVRQAAWLASHVVERDVGIERVVSVVFGRFLVIRTASRTTIESTGYGRKERFEGPMVVGTLLGELTASGGRTHSGYDVA